MEFVRRLSKVFRPRKPKYRLPPPGQLTKYNSKSDLLFSTQSLVKRKQAKKKHSKSKKRTKKLPPIPRDEDLQPLLSAESILSIASVLSMTHCHPESNVNDGMMVDDDVDETLIQNLPAFTINEDQQPLLSAESILSFASVLSMTHCHPQSPLNDGMMLSGSTEDLTGPPNVGTLVDDNVDQTLIQDDDDMGKTKGKRLFRSYHDMGYQRRRTLKRNTDCDAAMRTSQHIQKSSRNSKEKRFEQHKDKRASMLEETIQPVSVHPLMLTQDEEIEQRFQQQLTGQPNTREWLEHVEEASAVLPAPEQPTEALFDRVTNEFQSTVRDGFKSITNVLKTFLPQSSRAQTTGWLEDMADIESLSNPSYPSTLSLDNQAKQKALRTTMIGKEVALVHKKYHDSYTMPMAPDIADGFGNMITPYQPASAAGSDIAPAELVQVAELCSDTS